MKKKEPLNEMKALSFLSLAPALSLNNKQTLEIFAPQIEIESDRETERERVRSQERERATECERESIKNTIQETKKYKPNNNNVDKKSSTFVFRVTRVFKLIGEVQKSLGLKYPHN